MKNFDPIDRYCSEIQRLSEGGSKIVGPHSHGITDDMSGRWTIKAFDTDKYNKKETPTLKELIYQNNMGAMEVFKFFEKATDDEKAQLDTYINSGNQVAAWKLIEKVLGIKFQGSGPWNNA